MLFVMGTTWSLARDLEGRNPNSMADTLLLSQPYLEINLNSPLGIEFIIIFIIMLIQPFYFYFWIIIFSHESGEWLWYMPLFQLLLRGVKEMQRWIAVETLEGLDERDLSSILAWLTSLICPWRKYFSLIISVGSDHLLKHGQKLKSFGDSFSIVCLIVQSICTHN